MAPHWPEEVDVFTVPHSRMKSLIHLYNNQVMSTDFRDKVHLTSLLQNLHNVFTELKAHERIENMYIMGGLRSKLRAASISDPAVCNCHSDNRLTEMQDLVLDGYEWAEKPQRERQIYGRKLRMALEDFTGNFLPHMDMEEQVFQPMLMEYFSYEELKALKVKVIKQHGISKYEENCHEKSVSDTFESEESNAEAFEKEEELSHLDSLPNEVCHQILSLLGPQDLARVSQVSRRWAGLAQDPKLWTGIFPVHWAIGRLSFRPQSLDEDTGEGSPWGGSFRKEQLYFCSDEDADVDESGGDTDTHGNHTDSEEGRLSDILREAKLLTALVKYLLPKVGHGVKHCDLAFSRGLSNNLVHKILKLCPNLEVLDLRQTLVGDAAFREFGVNGRPPRLRHLDLSGCENISDLTLFSLASSSTSSTVADAAIHSESEKDEDATLDAANRKLESNLALNGDSDSNDAGARECLAVPTDIVEIESAEQACDTKKKGCCGGHRNASSVKIGTGEDYDGSVYRERNVLSCENHGHRGVQSSCPEGFVNSTVSSIESAAGEINKKAQTCCSSTAKDSPLEKERSGSRCGHDNDLAKRSGCIKEPASTPKTCRSRSNSAEGGDPQVCDLSYVYLDMLIQSEEVNADSDVCQVMATHSNTSPDSDSHDPSQTDLSLISGSEYIFACDDFQPATNVSQQHQCVGEISEGFSADSSDECSRRDMDHQHTGQDSPMPGAASSLEFLSLSGCYRVTSDGISALSNPPGMPLLTHLDLSGCVNVCGPSLRSLVMTAARLDHADLYYCDNLPGDPFPTTASGCRNRDCCTGSLYCCSLAE